MLQDAGSSGDEERRAATSHLQQTHTNERVSGHENYNVEESVGTHADGAHHDHEPKLTFKRCMAFTAMAFLWTGSQTPVYLFGGIAPYIYDDIGGIDRWIWFILANLLSLAAVCPFVGSISDLIRRRYVALMGSCFIILGVIIDATAHDMNTFIAGQVFAGIGAGINELTALAATSEMAPTSKRGKHVAYLVSTILPYCPSVLWSQLIAAHGSWRWVGLWCALWALIGFFLVLFFYFPPARVNSQGLSRKEILKQIDYIGGLLSISGIICFMLGIQWGGYMYAWTTAHVLAPLILGVLLLIAFVFWEAYGTKYPMFPKRLQKESRILRLTLLITLISGTNFIAVLMFWPTQSFNVYGHDPVQVGIRSLPVGFGISCGAFIVLWLLTLFKGHARELLVVASILMTAGTGAMAVSRSDNMYQLWAPITIACLGVGGIIVSVSVIATIICPDDLIATVAALTLSLRVIGGSIGFSTYYNVFYNKFVPAVTQYIVLDVMGLQGASLLDRIQAIPRIQATPGAYEDIVVAGQKSFAEAYKWVYYCSIAFGAISIIGSLFLKDIGK